MEYSCIGSTPTTHGIFLYMIYTYNTWNIPVSDQHLQCMEYSCIGSTPTMYGIFLYRIYTYNTWNIPV
ncbi:hypothetical protein DPMN_157270 [Dreissena polymorpha]|uniref:Uncharacterized protein n=1 Tax=Dreissena polymorpha TaxID=45954 RepID=A0A9D4INQ2_DREPO|nr:hypothetical protein DPMN_157268 [Dreissena polymorpha]KAH3779467.1 hypothetical protein DPMN_157270 [Dreissena polymorpha]